MEGKAGDEVDDNNGKRGKKRRRPPKRQTQVDIELQKEAVKLRAIITKLVATTSAAAAKIHATKILKTVDKVGGNDEKNSVGMTTTAMSSVSSEATSPSPIRSVSAISKTVSRSTTPAPERLIISTPPQSPTTFHQKNSAGSHEPGKIVQEKLSPSVTFPHICFAFGTGQKCAEFQAINLTPKNMQRVPEGEAKSGNDADLEPPAADGDVEIIFESTSKNTIPPLIPPTNKIQGQPSSPSPSSISREKATISNHHMRTGDNGMAMFSCTLCDQKFGILDMRAGMDHNCPKNMSKKCHQQPKKILMTTDALMEKSSQIIVRDQNQANLFPYSTQPNNCRHRHSRGDEEVRGGETRDVTEIVEDFFRNQVSHYYSPPSPARIRQKGTML